MPGADTNVFIDLASGNMPSIASGSVSCYNVWIGTNSATGPGTLLTISGGAQFITTQTSSSLSQSAPGTMNRTSSTVGIRAGATGGVLVTGSGSRWVENYGIYVGDAGTGTLSLRNGGGFEAPSSTGGLVVGGTAGGNGTVVVADSGSWIKVAGVCYAGSSAIGSVVVTNGGAGTNSASFTVGLGSGSSGAFLVSGVGSRWQAGSSTTIGSSGNGTLTIADGGTFQQAGSTTIGSSSSSKAMVTVTGTGSAWTLGTTPLRVGSSSTNASLTIADGGTVTVSSGGGTVQLGNTTVSGAVGTELNIGAPAGSAAVPAGTLSAASVTAVSGSGSKWVNFNHTDGSYTFGVPMSGTLRVRQSGSGTTILTGNNTHSGGTEISAGALQIGASGTSGSLSGNVTNNASLVFNRSDSLTHSGQISGTGSVTKTGAGELTLSGSNTFSGGLSVYAGSLKLAGSGTESLTGSGALTTDPGATLSGVGHVGGNATIGGTLSPGNSPGTLTFDGDLTLSSGSETVMELSTASSFDRLVISNTFTPAGTLTVTLIDSYDPAAGASFDLFDWGSLGSGSFATLDLPTLGAGRAWDTNDLYTTGTLRVVATAPTVSGNIAVPSDGSYRAGQVLGFTVTFSTNVTVVGTDAVLGLTIGSTSRNAAYASKTVNSVTFGYTLQAGDTDADGIAVGTITLNTTTIRDAGDNDADLTLTGHLPSTVGILVDTTAPTVSGNLSVPSDGNYPAGQTFTFTVGFSENVTIAGTNSTLDLTIGSSSRIASYASKTANSITYTYTVLAGDNDGDGIAVDALTLNGSTIQDGATNDADLTLTGHVPSTVGILVDTTAPTVSGNIEAPSDGSYGEGQTLSFAIPLSENVTVTGTDSTLGLTIGSTSRSAAYVSKTTNSIIYSYTVQAGENDSDGIAVGALTLNTTTVRDGATNDADLTLTGHIPSTAGILVDTTAPTVSGNLSVPSDGSYKAGQTLNFGVYFNEGVTVTGTDSELGLTIGSTSRTAAYVSKTTNSVNYSYTIQAGETDSDGITVGSLTLNTTTIRDAATNDADLTLTGHLPSTTGILVDTTAPTVSGNISVPSDGSYRAGQTFNFTVGFGENVTVTGTDSTLGLTIGSTTREAAYASKTTNTVSYSYTVQAGDTDADGIAVGSLTLNTTTIRDGATNDADLTLTGHVPSTTGILVDTTAPTVSGNISVPSDGSYKSGQTLSFTLPLSENVTVTGTDSTLGLTIGSTSRSAAYASKTTNSVTYSYTVQAGDGDSDGIAVGAVSLNTTTIRDAATNDADLTLTGPPARDDGDPGGHDGADREREHRRAERRQLQGGSSLELHGGLQRERDRDGHGQHAGLDDRLDVAERGVCIQDGHECNL